MAIVDMQRRIQEAGRIRIGRQVETQNGKTHPAKLDTFRLTSADRARIQQAAELYGGTPGQWDAPAGRQWEVVTAADALNVIVPPSTMAFSQYYELWSKGGCQRRCDGVTESIGDQPCVCDPDARECSIHTRLSVMIRDLSGLGVWRIDTSGYYAAVELSGAVEVVQVAAGRGSMLPARLRLEQREVKRQDAEGKPQTRRFAVPVLDIEVSPAQLLSGEAGAPAAIDTGSARAIESAKPPLTPVPADLPTGPRRSIADQSAPPPPKPKRSNAAPEIPSCGRRRGPAPAEEPPEEDGTAVDEADGDAATPKQNRQIFALFGDLEITDRNERLRYASLIVGRQLDSFHRLTRADASTLIDALTAVNESDDPKARLNQFASAAAAAEGSEQ